MPHFKTPCFKTGTRVTVAYKLNHFQKDKSQRQLLPSFPFKQDILKCLVSHFLNFKTWIKLIYDTVDVCNFVINEFDPTFEAQNMGNEALQNAWF